MILIEDYMKLSREETRLHLDLNTPCDVRGGESKQFRGLLAHHLGTSIPSGRFIFLCHACNVGGCSNVQHIYWGSPKDNHLDQVEAGTFQNLYERTIEKHGVEFQKQLAARNGSNRKGAKKHGAVA